MDRDINIENNKQGSIYELIEKIRNSGKRLPDIILSIQNGINDHIKSLPSGGYKPKSIIESRFTSPEEAYKIGMKSCGATVNICAEILLNLGFKFKLIHGECEESVDHAWIKVLNPENDKWEEYDLTREDMNTTPHHIIKAEVDSWDEIKDKIIEDSRTLSERREERGI